MSTANKLVDIITLRKDNEVVKVAVHEESYKVQYFKANDMINSKWYGKRDAWVIDGMIEALFHEGFSHR